MNNYCVIFPIVILFKNLSLVLMQKHWFLVCHEIGSPWFLSLIWLVNEAVRALRRPGSAIYLCLVSIWLVEIYARFVLPCPCSLQWVHTHDIHLSVQGFLVCYLLYRAMLHVLNILSYGFGCPPYTHEYPLLVLPYSVQSVGRQIHCTINLKISQATF